MVELSVISPDWSTVGLQKRRVLLTGDVVERLIEVARNGRAVFALEMDIFAVAELELAHQRVVGVGELLVLAAFNHKYFVGTVDGGDLADDVTGFGERVVVDH